MADAKRAVVVGIPGVGKTTVIIKALELLRDHGVMAEQVVFGTVMFNEASKRLGVKHRDELRGLPLNVQRELQVQAANAISKMDVDLLFIDTHLLVHTAEGYWPGLPLDVLRALSPTNLILIEASPLEVLSRRSKDAERYRNSAKESDIIRELNMARDMLSASGILSGAPMLIVENTEGHPYMAAREIVKALGVG